MRLDPASEQKLYLNVLQPPPLFWSTPSEVQITRGGRASVSAKVVRFEGKYRVDVEPKSPIPGLHVGKVSAAPDSDDIEIPLDASEGIEGSAAALILVAAFERNGQIEHVESPPIAVRLKP